jgi:hypothetical protein
MSSAQRHAPRKPISPNRSAPPDTVDPVWLIKALALSLVAALICGYATICLLYYQGEWQLILHPNRMVDRTPASTGLLYTNVQFDAAETGQPRLTAWWIPAQSPKPPGAGYAAFTVLYLHDGSGSLADTVPMLANLHRAGFKCLCHRLPRLRSKQQFRPPQRSPHGPGRRRRTGLPDLHAPHP